MTDDQREIDHLRASLTALSQAKESDRALVYAIATEPASELAKICGVAPRDDSARLNYLAELFAPPLDLSEP